MSLKTFLDNYQDTFITEVVDIVNKYPNNMIKQELDLLDIELTRLKTLVDSQVNVINEGCLDFKNNYDLLINSIKNKIEFINSSASIFNKLNVSYDLNSVVDYLNINLFNSLHTNLLYDDSKEGFTLNYDFVTYRCNYLVNSDLDLVVYNNNKNFHNSIILESSNLDLFSEFTLIILKIDGTVITKVIQNINSSDKISIEHPIADSLNITIKTKFKNSSLLNAEKMVILDTFKISLSLNKYLCYDTLMLPTISLKSGKYVLLSQTTKVPADCYINYIITISGQTFSVPVNNSIVCKRLDLLNVKEVAKIVGMYIKNDFTRDHLDLDYLLTLDNKNEKYVIYESKLKESVVLNNTIQILNNTNFKLVNYIKERIDIELTVEFYSFNKNETPVLKNIVGFTKNE